MRRSRIFRIQQQVIHAEVPAILICQDIHQVDTHVTGDRNEEALHNPPLVNQAQLFNQDFIEQHGIARTHQLRVDHEYRIYTTTKCSLETCISVGSLLGPISTN